MTGKTHLAGGVAVGLLAGQALRLLTADAVVVGDTIVIPTVTIALAGVAFGSLLPDIDEPNAMVSNLPKKGRGIVNTALKRNGVEGIVRGVVTLVLLTLNLITRTIAKLVKSLVGHRGATHWILTSVIIGGLFSGIGFFFGYPELGLWIWLGYISHILFDAMTLSGVEMWQPFTGKTYHLLPPGFRIRTGSIIDTGLGLGLGVLDALLIYLALLPVVQLHDVSLPLWLNVISNVF